MTSSARRLIALLPLVAVVTLGACGGRARELPLGASIGVGVEPVQEAARVTEALEGAGYVVRDRIAGAGFVAIGFAREADEHRAVRVVTRLGVVVALDSHETDDVRVRHGAVSLVRTAEQDLDGDGRPEIVLAREADGRTCLALVRTDDQGGARAVRVESDAVAPGSCASAIADVDGDGRSELIVEMEWPMLALDEREVPVVRVPLVAHEGGWRANGLPSTFADAERARLREELTAARAELDVAAASRIGVVGAALENLAGVPLATQLERYDQALRGLVLREDERDRVDAIRAYIAAGWSARGE